MIAGALALAIRTVGTILPERVLRWVLRQGATLAYLHPGVRQALLDNARHLVGPSSEPRARRRLALAVCRSFGDAIADLLIIRRRYAGDELPIEVHGREHFQKAMSMDRGIVGVTLHMGSYELGSLVVARRSPGVAIVYHRDRAGFFEKLRSSQRSFSSVDEVAVDASPFFGIEILNRLRRKETVLIAGELAAGLHGEPFPFVDGVADFSLWPVRVAATSGAPILPAFMVRDDHGQLVLHLEEPIIADRDDPHSTMLQLVRIFERYVAQYPEQWLMVRSFWRS